MREFHAFEYVDGDIKVFVREKGQGDDAWRETGLIKYGTQVRVYDLFSQWGLAPMDGAEVLGLTHAISRPRRW